MAIPTSPGDLRSPRKRALEIGTSPAGFGPTIPYDAQAGVPLIPGVTTSGHYRELPPGTSDVGSPINAPIPFALKK